MWQSTWSPHQPQGALPGQQACTTGSPFQGMQSSAIGAHPMNQPHLVGSTSAPHGCHQGSMGSPVLGPLPFHGPGGQLQSNFSSPMGSPVPGHQGQGFSVQYKHHQGCHSSIQSQQLMVGSNLPGSHQPMGPGSGSQHGCLQGTPTPWSTQPAPQQPLPQLPQQVLQQPDASSNPLWSPQCGHPSPFSLTPTQPNPVNMNQPKPCLQNTPTTPLCQLPQGPQHQPLYPGPQVPQVPQVHQAQNQPATQGQSPTVQSSPPTSTSQLDPSKTTPTPSQAVQAPTITSPTLDLQALEQRLGATL